MQKQAKTGQRPYIAVKRKGGKSVGSLLFDGINYLLLTLFAIATIIPFLYILAGSLTPADELTKQGFVLIPSRLTLDAYSYLLASEAVIRGLGVSIYITAVGTFINILFTVLMAYALARKELKGRQPILLMVIFSMLFSGGMIPTFLIVKTMGLLDSYWSLMIPGAINAFNLIVMKNFFQQLPEGLEESAKMDGCNDLGILFRIVIPLSLPVIVTFVMFYAVGHWNSYFTAILYINDTEKWPLQVLVRQLIILSQGGLGESNQDSFNIPAQTVNMAMIVLSTLPILIVYPFLQKHFTKGILLGSVKG
ncbi:carbohydrate ABC transporter permease [Paenibacillus radicis (ex Xue et al. 2023)]|uniref:Carbohydrate ABC transporter permease n=1 Tax=Paenibacillus radicis (ex Xue et al. 2023) TaxID=2972489 RepID=A0ABT1YJQ7_9BACL|nr:carbohydrate ABC transporter permease [Paenibacillus radicis (ex Xue et al. 2023)]MCR8632488.1 carbohydrate ABC transporter permease [Paenibacillus radicis (ex Xue et al. 2023)]